ncbi:MAG: FAD-dependent oxidoreductase [Oscillospiraceae bacterium]|nr:FAD-dependent oxidoreductase [Oscillospiraceae bacterium]MBQ2154683.1 FAD-dependent oxidoreductase [Oscillospiraceae bacterium]
MKEVELLIIGSGPAGLCAAISAASSGARVLILERSFRPGGQLIKQTHMFFGSEAQYASHRGVDIADILLDKVRALGDRIEIMLNTTAVAFYEDNVVTALKDEKEYFKIKAKSIVCATGAFEKSLAFPNNDLPGIYGAGAVQTLMNVYGVKPGDRVLMVGAGNIGVIVSYQLMQAGIQVVAVLDAAPRIGAYLVHASKLARMGVPILTSHTVKEAIGTDCIEAAVVCEVDEKFQPIPGTETRYDVDVLCISVGLSPLNELLAMRGVEMKYVPQLSGSVPMRTETCETCIPGVFVAGDASGIEEASSAMVEGYLAGLCAAAKLGHVPEDFEARKQDYLKQLEDLRSGPVGDRIRAGMKLTQL